ncbi:MAG: EAL domain-containing protein [Gammaproteobacteria bacterium]|nr:EAL domain-containing protein [Gammaproteobacteria bacterium]
MKLLIAEDDLTSRVMLSGVTAEWKFEPIAVADGKAALEEMTKEDHPYLLLVDWEMPIMDGVELCKRIREVEERGCPPYIIILTSRSGTANIVTGLESGANDFISKPFEPNELQARLNVGRRMVLLQQQLSSAFSRLQLTASVFTQAREGIIITDIQGTITEVNDAFSNITGYPRDEVLGRNPDILKSGRQSREFYKEMWQSLNDDGYWSGELWNRKKNGEFYPELLNITAVNNEDGKRTHYIALFLDITKQKEHQLQLEHFAHYDALTNLPNRVLLADRLQQAISQTSRRKLYLAVCFLDLDGFKQVNDTHGHDVGDLLLVEIANRMKKTVREGDTVARLGGDEFAIVLTDFEDPEASLPLVKRLLEVASKPILVNRLKLQVSASLGTTYYPQQEVVDADQLLRQADQAMYQAKLAGKNRYHTFDTVSDREIRGRHESIEDITTALEQGQFLLYYQPKVNMRSGEVVGAEALIRWNHPQQGLLLPDKFLPIIEEHPLSIELGEWVIETALSQREEWRSFSGEFSLSVNVGSLLLQQVDFVSRLEKILQRHPEFNPELLKLEILETSALKNLKHIQQAITNCKEYGTSFSLDDFGTGYSSLTYFKQLKVEELKIDKSFVFDMLDDPDDLSILESVIGMASAFRRTVIAEGVESIEHGEMLLDLGCDLAQGFIIARPMAADDFGNWYQQWQPPQSWKNRPLVDSGDIPLIYAMVEHRAWVRTIGNFIVNSSISLPEMDHHQCRFGQWLYQQLDLNHYKQKIMTEIVEKHRLAHQLGNEIIRLVGQGQSGEAEETFSQLQKVREMLIHHIRSLFNEHNGGL